MDVNGRVEPPIRCSQCQNSNNSSNDQAFIAPLCHVFNKGNLRHGGTTVATVTTAAFFLARASFFCPCIAVGKNGIHFFAYFFLGTFLALCT